jgi:hypothetical protein
LFLLIILELVRAAGLEPAKPKPRDFKSLVFTNFTTPAPGVRLPHNMHAQARMKRGDRGIYAPAAVQHPAAPLLHLCCTFAAPLLHLCCTFAAPALDGSGGAPLF